MQVGIEKKTVVSRSFYLLFAGFAIALVYDLVMAGGSLENIMQQAAVTSLLLGIVGLVAGRGLYAEQIRHSRPTDKDAENVMVFGIGTFAVMTFLNYMLGTLRHYQADIQTQSMILVLAAAPFEEAFFRFAIAGGLYHGLLAIIKPIFKQRKMGGAEEFTMVLTALITSYFFIEFHAAVYNIADPQVWQFLFLNSMAYTIVYLYTGNLMVSTTAHLLNNAAAIMLSVLIPPLAMVILSCL
jgi:membrane protease YdiL (CAAX protease family)